jgi:predicted dehydrogenase
LKNTLAAAATVTLAGTKSSGRVLGANEAIRIGVAGLNGRGGSHVNAFSKLKGVEVAYLIDPDTRTYAKHLKTLAKQSTKPTMVQDIRKALEDKNLDAVSVATPNHWHALITIWACQAGKDVYVEKPCSHEVHEGRMALTAARKYNRIVQHGTQGRSDARNKHLAELVKSGTYGKLLVSRGLCYKPRKSIGEKPVTSPPPEVDFNIWLGPAPARPFHANLVHYNWHWFWDFGNGDIGNQGVHQMDAARWMIPGAKLPKSVVSLGGRFGYQDQGETPNSQIALFDYGDTQLIFEVRGLDTDAYNGVKIGNTLHFENGMVAGGKFYAKGSTKGEPLPKGTDKKANDGEEGHFGNFISAVRSRKTSDLNADIEEGHYSAALCHLANISFRLGQQVPFVPQTKAFGDNKDAYESLMRMSQYLHATNGIKIDGLTYQLGRKLTINPQTESFVDDKEADKLLVREYRKPFAPTELASL